MTALQKLLAPALSDAISLRGAAGIAGPVVPADEVANLRPDELLEAYGLAGPTSPFPHPVPYVDVLRFEPHPLMALQAPVDVGQRPWPTYATGFLPGAVPVWFCAHTRVPTGTEFWRIRADGEQKLLSAYAGPAHGWRGAQGYQPPLELTGPRATWRGHELPAAFTADSDAVELVHVGDDGVPARFEKVRPTVHRLVVPITECERVFELDLVAAWQGERVRVIRSDGRQARVQLLAPQADALERPGVTEVEPGVLEALVAVGELTASESRAREFVESSRRPAPPSTGQPNRRTS